MKIKATILTSAAVLLLSGCSIILDFEVGTWDCWCGERWETTIYGAQVNAQGGQQADIPPEQTTHIACVSMLEHIVLDLGDPNSVAYQAIVDGFEIQAIANCEAAAAQVPNMSNNNCDSNQVIFDTQHNGACWREANFDEGDCSQHASECTGKYDCTDPWITAKDADGETSGGGDDVVWSVTRTPLATARPAGARTLPSRIARSRRSSDTGAAAVCRARSARVRELPHASLPPWGLLQL